MEIYLIIITTILVLTQIIRVCQNARQLRNYEDAKSDYNMQVRVFRMLESALERMEEEEDA